MVDLPGPDQASEESPVDESRNTRLAPPSQDAGAAPHPPTRPSVPSGALAGALTVLAFAALHAAVIVDIWFNIVPMLLSGAICGACLVWSYHAAVPEHSPRRWLAYIGACAALLCALGAASLLVLEPRFTMTELIGDDDALGRLLPPALPLMGAAVVVGTGVLWVWLGRRPAALLPLLVGQALLVLLVGHNLAILGLVEMSSQIVRAFAEFVGLTVFLAGLFAAGVGLLGARASRPARAAATPPAG